MTRVSSACGGGDSMRVSKPLKFYRTSNTNLTCFSPIFGRWVWRMNHRVFHLNYGNDTTIAGDVKFLGNSAKNLHRFRFYHFFSNFVKPIRQKRDPIKINEGGAYINGFPVGETSWSRCSRSAGDRQPRALDDACANDGEGNLLGCACGIRGPKSYDAGDVFHRSAGACPPRWPSSRCVFPLETSWSDAR